MARRPQLRWFALLVLGASVLTACTVSVSGGLIGGGVAGLLGLLLVLTAGASQTGCAQDTPTPDPEEDAYVGPCLSQVEPDGGLVEPDAVIGPCLGAPLSDASVGPCLGPLPPEAGVDAAVDAAVDLGADVPIGPCLDVPADATVRPDVSLGPCLDAPFPEDAGAALDPGPSRDLPTVDAIRAKVLAQGNLPADVVARLQKKA